jgi:thiamine pyrophosphokinase
MECRMTTLIFANGQFSLADGADWLQPYLESATLLIAADGGTLHLRALSLWPDVLVGDLDSIPHNVRAGLAAAGTRIVAHPEDKDATDLELALLYAVAHTAPQDEILVLGALGGRLDQMVANLLLLAHPDLVGRRVKIVAPWQEAWLASEETLFAGAPGDILSLIPLDEEVHVAETEGLAWPLRDEQLIFGQARGVSNRLTAAHGRLRLRRGRLLVVHIRTDGPDWAHVK